MKLGVLQFFSWPERRVDLATVYARALSDMRSTVVGARSSWVPH